MRARRAQRHDMLATMFEDWHLPLEIRHGGRVVYRNGRFENSLSALSGPYEVGSDHDDSFVLNTRGIVDVSLFRYESVENDPIRASMQLCMMLILSSSNLDAREEAGQYTVRYFKQATPVETLDALVRRIDGVSDVKESKSRAYWCSCCDMFKGYECVHQGKPAMVEAVQYQVATEEALAAYSRDWVESMKKTGKLFRHQNILKNLLI